MDLLHKRYASPFSFMDGMIQTGRLCSFVENVISAENKEKEEKTQWEFFLHKVFEGTFADFKEDLRLQKELQNMSEDKIETTINHSMNILKTFNPDKGGE